MAGVASPWACLGHGLVLGTVFQLWHLVDWVFGYLRMAVVTHSHLRLIICTVYSLVARAALLESLSLRVSQCSFTFVWVHSSGTNGIPLDSYAPSCISAFASLYILLCSLDHAPAWKTSAQSYIYIGL